MPSIFLEPLHIHNCLEIGCCLEGRGNFYFSDKVYKVYPGDVFVVNSPEPHIMQSDSNDPGKFLFVFFSSLFIEKFNRDLLKPFLYKPDNFNNRIPASSELASELNEIIKRIYEEDQKKEMSYDDMAKSLLLQACTLIRRHYRSNQDSAEDDYVSINYNRLRSVIDYIHDHYNEDIKLRDIAAILYMSESRARHLFKETAGVGFKEYLSSFRIENAKWLLTNTYEDISDICFRCGFQSQAPFYRAFKNMTGTSPSQYRNKFYTETVR